MNFGVVFVLLFMIYGARASIYECYYQYKHACNNSRGINNSLGLCSLENIREADIKLSSEGVLKVDLNLPDSDCNYKVALLVNSTIKSEEECKNYVFSEDNGFEGKVHSSDRTICVSAVREIGNNLSNISCAVENVTLEYQYIYTGCYALRFSIDGRTYVTRFNKYFETNYQLENIQDPSFRCSFDNREIRNDSSNLVTFNLEISMLSISPSMVLEMRSMSFEDETKANACHKHSKKSPYEWDISLDKCGHKVKNCNFMVIHNNTIVSNGIYTGDIECSFLLPVSFNDSYCFLMTLIDERCAPNTIWDPPPKDSPPCVWMTQCNRIVKSRSTIVYPGPLQEGKIVTADSVFIFPIAVGIILLVLVICGITFSVYRWHLASEQAYLNANLRELKVAHSFEGDGFDTDDETRRIGNNSLDNQPKAIVLLYARGSPAFMGLMSEFREILKQYCSCHVYDWYAACEWNAVAKVGACDWATDLFKKNHRAVWIDTPAARSLMNTRSSNESGLNEDAISDFRDMAFPAVLDCAKRSIVNAKLQYSQHFVIRLEGVNANSIRDPFSDLSPHARYLIPYHLSQLCSHLSSRKSDSRGNALMTVEVQLRERLLKSKNDL